MSLNNVSYTSDIINNVTSVVVVNEKESNPLKLVAAGIYGDLN